MRRFDHKAIEEKWRARWRESGLYDVGARDPKKEKEYVLVEWPYPSGNLHIGHWYAFAVPDIYVRAHRMQGKQVLFPMGFDAFGLPAENAAIKRNLDPKKWTEDNVAFMRQQLESMGAAFSWDKTTSSTDPEYYAWTQWMFTEFFRRDIAYRGKGIVNWCPGCNTVIANEQVLADGTCERSGDLIEKREMPQWMIRITQYADRLIDDLDALAWPEPIKDSQRNWIGRSQGAEIPFALSTGDTVEVFTTRADTLCGATHLVLAPEHPLVTRLSDDTNSALSNTDDVRAYVTRARAKSDIERTNETKEKTGVELKGLFAINPATKKEMPVWVGDYVLAGYGTGAIMAVPAHDERDFAFAQTYGIEPIRVIAGDEPLPCAREGTLINSGVFDGFDSEKAKVEIAEHVGGRMTNTYRLRDWSIGRQRYWGVPIPIVYDPEGVAHPVPKEHLPWTLPTDVDFRPTGEAPLAKSQELKERTERIFGAGWRPEVETMDTFVDSSWYFLRYLNPRNTSEISSLDDQRAWMPVDLYFGGAEHTTMHLLYSRFWQKALFDLGLVTEEEPYRTRINRGLVLGPDGNKMSKSKGNVIDPDEQVGRLGADTVRMYLAFMGPYGETSNYPWDMGGIAGIRRFLERVYALQEKIVPEVSEKFSTLRERTIKKVTLDIEHYKFNTAISSLMILLNTAEKEGIDRESYVTFVKLLAPFAPYLAEELWAELGEMYSVHQVPWPSYDESKTVEKEIKIAVQIKGKVRGTITIPAGATQDVVMKIILSAPDLKNRVGSIKITKTIYVPNKIINLIPE